MMLIPMRTALAKIKERVAKKTKTNRPPNNPSGNVLFGRNRRVIRYLLLDNSRKVVSCGKEKRRGMYVLKSH